MQGLKSKARQVITREAVELEGFKVFIVRCPKALAATGKKREGSIGLEVNGSMLAPSL